MADKMEVVELSSSEDEGAGPNENGKPSQVEDEYWIWAFNRSNRNNRKSDYSKGENKCGKWMIFENVSRIDDAWDKVSQAVKRGDLGHTAKVSTMKDKAAGRGGNASQSVICVYTYDWTDETDVFRVREGLRDIGFEKVLRYKTDEDTLAGNYSGQGKRVSKYSS